MKTGLTLVQLAQELTAQQESQRDFPAPTSSLSMLGNGTFHLETNNERYGRNASYALCSRTNGKSLIDSQALLRSV